MDSTQNNLNRDEYYNSAEFASTRFINNLAASLTHTLQQLEDAYDIAIHIADMSTVVNDTFTVAERQIRVCKLEVDRLRQDLNKVIIKLEQKNQQRFMLNV